MGLDPLESLGASETSKASSLEIAVGDITDADAVGRAAEGCDVVIHCAALQGTRARLAAFRRVNVGGTLNLLRAARAERVSQFVHISTINVHGYPPPHDANAESPLRFDGDFYSISKAEGERAARDFARENDFPLTVIRPACTYGPRSDAWTMQPLHRVRRGAPVLIGRGDGICNAVYIDNLVDLIVLTLKNDAAIGQAFIGSEGRGVTWREFYGAYAAMIGMSRVNSLPHWAALALAAASQAAARLTGGAPFLSRASVEFYTHHVVYKVSKAEKLLGYAPRVSFEEGMKQTKAWLVEIGQKEESRAIAESNRRRTQRIAEESTAKSHKA
jgi:nucleoside-diphosphate-sugar epimerase